MLQTINDFIQRHLALASETGERQEQTDALAMASIALLLEVTRADYQVEGPEMAAVKQAVRQHLGVSEDQAKTLIKLAEEELTDSTDYFQFTALINQHYSMEQKTQLIEWLWRVAFADEELHKYEERLVRRISDLLYVPHGSFLAAKHRASGN